MPWIYFISLLLLLLFVYVPRVTDIFILLFSQWLSGNIFDSSLVLPDPRDEEFLFRPALAGKPRSPGHQTQLLPPKKLQIINVHYLSTKKFQ